MDQVKDELLHYIHGIGPHAFSDHIRYLIKNASEWCPFSNHKGRDALSCYNQDENVIDLINILNRYQIIIDYIENDPYYSSNLKSLIEDIKNPNNNFPIKVFMKNINNIVNLLSEYEKALYKKLKGFTCLECSRLDEAITCQSNNCFLSTTIMAVSATEARLHYLVKKKNKAIYKKYFEDATLGQLIEIFDKDKYKDKIFTKLKTLVPKRHKPLLDMFNEHRIVSAHPKVSSIDHKIAKAILSLAFAFLLDPEVKVTERKLLKH